MFDITPTKSPSDPPRPSLRFTKKLTRDAKPTVVVTGIGSNDTVTIVDESGSTVGEGVGSGKIKLTGKLKVGNDAKTGANVLKARSAGRESAPITLVVDTEAQTPTIKHSGDMQTLTVTGEPNGRVEFFASDKQPITTVFLDKDGTGTVKMPMDGRGFVGAYGIGKEWNKPLFYRIDPEIKFDYQDGPPDPKVQSDIFCIRWTGVLDVSTTGDYTFYLATDDGSKLWIDSKQIIEHWGVHGYEEPKTATVKLEKGLHPVRVDYYEENGWAGAHLEWSGPGIERTHSLQIFLPLATDGHPTMLFKQTDAAGNVSKPAK
jgi:hypothetical protein